MFISKPGRSPRSLRPSLLTGCAGSIERWIVNTRVHQGDVALERGNARDAELAYRLALRVDPKIRGASRLRRRPRRFGPARV